MDGEKNLPAAPTKANALQKKSSAVVVWHDTDKASLAILIGRVFDLQKQYGKTTAQLENIIAGFIWALAPYDPQKVAEAFGKYVLTRSDMPTPFDIRNIIDPTPPPWEPDKSYYFSLKKLRQESGEFALTTEESEYIKKYEEHVQTAARA